MNNPLGIALQIAAILLSIVMVILILLQVKGGSKMLGTEAGGGMTRTRRGLEKLLFQLTIGFSVAFITISIFAVAFTQR
jgi:preprotein translocase subunit SecG